MPPENPKAPSSLLTPQGLVKAALRAHPAFKYAMAVAGIAALVAIVSTFGVSMATIVVGVFVGLFFMFVFLIFSVAARAKDQQLGTVVLVVVWSLAILFIVVLALVVLSLCIDQPFPLKTYAGSLTIAGSHGGYAEETQEDVRKLREKTGTKPDPVQVQHEVELRKEEPQRFRKGEIYWPIGATIRVGFLDGKKEAQDRVLAVAHDWTKYANINFVTAPAQEADVRVSFKTLGEWSLMGTQCLTGDKKSATTSLGPPIDFQDEKQSRHYILHAFGHVLGLIHEFQIPAAKGAIDLEKAYQYFSGPPTYWSREQFDLNVAPLKEVDSIYDDERFDPYSVMMGYIPEEARIVKWSGDGGSELSSGDISLIRKIYPGR